MNSIYSLKLHETTQLNCGPITYHVVRVAGGWIYNHIRLDSGQMNMVFVPFDYEYEPGFTPIVDKPDFGKTKDNE